MESLRKLRKTRKNKLNNNIFVKDKPFITDIQINRYGRDNKTSKPVDNIVVTFEFVANVTTSLRDMHDFLKEVDKLCISNPDVWK